MATLAQAITFATPFPTTESSIEEDPKLLTVTSDSTATMATLPSLLPDGSSSTDTTPETVELRLDQPAAAVAPRRRRFSLDLFGGGGARRGGAKAAQRQPSQPAPRPAIKVIASATRPRAKSINAARPAIKARTSTSSFSNGSAFHEHLSDDEDDDDDEEETMEEDTAEDGLDVPTVDSSLDSDAPQRAATMDARQSPRARAMRRVSFSPSTDEMQKAREEAQAAAAAAKERVGFWKRISGGGGGGNSKKSRKSANKDGDDDDDEEGASESHDEEEQSRPSTPAIRPRRSSLVLVRTHSKQDDDETAASNATHAPSSSTAPRKRRPSLSRVNKHTALAQKHARNLEQLVNSSHDHPAHAAMVVGGAKKQQQQRKGGDVVSKRNVKKLKRALMDEKLAHGIIGELRAMEGPRAVMLEIDGEASSGAPAAASAAASSPAQLALQEAAAAAGASSSPAGAGIAKPGFVGQMRKRLLSNATPPAEVTPVPVPAPAPVTAPRGRPAPQRAICLDCGEAEAERRHQEAMKPKPAAKKESMAGGAGMKAKVAATSPATDMLLGLGNRLKYLGFGATNAAEASPAAVAVAEEEEALERDFATPTSLQPAAANGNSTNPQLLGVTTLNLLSLSPPTSTPSLIGNGIKGAALSSALDASGALPALSSLSGAVIRASGSDVGIHPPLDRMALFIHWWGYEITLPPPTMAYLSTARSVSGAFLNFLSTMVVTGGVPEMAPFISYISMALDVEFKAIQQADRGKGVVLAATWVIPMALVPRGWDYETGPAAGGGGAPTSPPPGQGAGNGNAGGAAGGTPGYWKRKVVQK